MAAVGRYRPGSVAWLTPVRILGKWKVRDLRQQILSVLEVEDASHVVSACLDYLHGIGGVNADELSNIATASSPEKRRSIHRLLERLGLRTIETPLLPSKRLALGPVPLKHALHIVGDLREHVESERIALIYEGALPVFVVKVAIVDLKGGASVITLDLAKGTPAWLDVELAREHRAGLVDLTWVYQVTISSEQVRPGEYLALTGVKESSG
jgi:hypothetical protein